MSYRLHIAVDVNLPGENTVQRQWLRRRGSSCLQQLSTVRATPPYFAPITANYCAEDTLPYRHVPIPELRR